MVPEYLGSVPQSLPCLPWNSSCVQFPRFGLTRLVPLKSPPNHTSLQKALSETTSGDLKSPMGVVFPVIDGVPHLHPSDAILVGDGEAPELDDGS